MMKITGKGEIKKIGGSLFVRLPPELLLLLETTEYDVEVVIDKDKNEISIMLHKIGGGEKND